ncbi:hypothetical protein FXN63_10315 [Pigmentiphaga aceris]|uniref:Uncharacterized protein n=1 Tax=Pigmentiphaga aceris TaxID=1940612 RepID=A0A5C0AVG4_9BURK|nr:hypothetical protein [Pigmentiphaga aceris]QEI06185.1 hypothetical protein FXN63_10315 [Pigmentiphaga aceris]
MPNSHEEIDVWSVEGRFSQLIFSPKGAIEGVLIDTDGVPTQFVLDPNDPSTTEQFAGLKPGQALVLEGCLADPSPKGEPAHVVYAFERVASVDGEPPKAPRRPDSSTGVVVRFNYAKHGAVNGVVLDNGDFIHTKPGGFDGLGLKIGDTVKAKGPAKPLITGTGHVIEAHKVNGVKL